MADSKALIVRNGDVKHLKFPYKHVLMFSDEKAKNIDLTETIRKKLYSYVTLFFFQPTTSKGDERKVSDLKIFNDSRFPYDDSFDGLSETECKAIFERLAPEYTVVMNEIDPVAVKNKIFKVTDEDLRITGKELEFKTFFLDDYQVGIVNDMGKGHRVILANPGAGKSVLLLSKAFKYASLFKESNVLLTCYNNNLADSYSFKRGCANFGNNNNLFIMTFHKLVKKIYQECLHISLQSNIATEEEIQKCINLVKQGRVNLKFKAIFIDEVQIFDPNYLELCYALLDTSDDNYVFLMAGDLNQAVRTLSRRGDAPWKRINGVKLDFTGRVRYIEKNYRNSKEIGDYILKMLTKMNDRLEMLGLINSMEYEYNSFKTGEKPATAIKIRTGINRINAQKELIKAVKEISETYKVSYSDIAIIFPYKQHERIRYYFLAWVKQALDDAGIPYSLITSDDNPFSRKAYSETTGIVLTTIDSSLGLDFKAVIFAGLYPYQFLFGDDYFKKEIKSWESIKAMSSEDQAKVQSQMRSMYTACSRARDVLYVLSDLSINTPMDEIIKK